MKNKLLLTLTLLVFCFPAFSQTSDSVAFKNQIGIIASPSLQYLFQNKFLPVGLIYKRQVKPDQAWRFSVSGQLFKYRQPTNIYNQDNMSSTFYFNRTSYYATALIGYEWQKQLSKRWTFYYGTDAGGGYEKSKTTYDFSDYKPTPSTYFSNQHSDYSGVRFILQPLAGIRFNVSPRLYLATETHIAINYSHSNQKNMETSFFESQGPVTRELNNSSNSSLNINYSPLSNIQLVYQF